MPPECTQGTEGAPHFRPGSGLAQTWSQLALATYLCQPRGALDGYHARQLEQHIRNEYRLAWMIRFTIDVPEQPTVCAASLQHWPLISQRSEPVAGKGFGAATGGLRRDGRECGA
jgi:hypothetical protein